MAEKIISPGVFTDEIDETFLPSAIADIGGVVIGPTVKGPALVPTVVSSYSEYQALFGDSFKSGSNYYTYLTSLTAKEYLKNNNTLTVVRVLAGSYSGASTTVSSSIDPAIVGGGSVASASIQFVGTAGGGDAANNAYLTGSENHVSFSIGGSTGSNAVAGGFVEFAFNTTSSADQEYGSDGSSVSQSNSATKIWINIGNGGNHAKYPYQEKTFVTLAKAGITASLVTRDAINDSASLHGLAISASAGGDGTNTNATNVLTMSFTGSKGAFGLYGNGNNAPYGATLSGSGWSTLNPVVTSSLSMSIVSPIDPQHALNSARAFQGGEDFSTTYKTPFKLHTLSDGEVLNSGDGANLKSGTNNLLLSGSEDNLRYEITSVNKEKGLFSLQIRRGNDTQNRKSVLESWNNVDLDPNSNSYIAKVIGDSYISIQDAGTTEPYLKSFGQYPNKSNYVRVEVLEQTIDYLDENGDVRNPAASASLPTFHSGSNSGSYGGSFSGGDDGTVTHPKTFYENIAENSSQGLDPSDNGGAGGYNDYIDALNLLSNQDDYDINLILMPGIIDSVHSGICSKAINVCEDRGDCFVVVDPVTKGATQVSTVITEAETRNSNYAAMYWPWIKLPENSLGRNVWVPPSVAMAGVYTFNDKVSHEWFAPAGLNRGQISNATQVERKLTQSNRDDLYNSNVNPIATFPGQGVVVFGQKTLQKKASAFDRVNVRRLMIKLKKFIASSSRFLVFEQNTAKTRQRFLNIVNPYMEQVQSQSGVSAFRVVMDETNNTPDTVDRNILYGQIFIQPTRTAEFIVLDFTVQPSGATFPE